MAGWVKSAFESAGFELSRITPVKKLARDAYYAQQSLLSGRDVTMILDIGANTGQTARKYRAMFPRATIHSFEPFDKAFAQLSAEFASDAMVKPHKLAMSDASGSRTLFVNRDDTTNSLLPSSNSAGAIDTSGNMKTVAEIQVPVSTIDDFCAANRIDSIDLLKMDIQGGEAMALRGAKQMLSQQKITLVYSEVLFASLYQDQAHFVDVFSAMREHGYRLFGLYDLNYPQGKGLAWGDAIFISPELAKRACET